MSGTNLPQTKRRVKRRADASMIALDRAEVREELAQEAMFQAGEELPLFSGTPIHVDFEQFIDLPTDKQAKFADCPICFDTHTIKVKGKTLACWCQGSQDERTRTELLAGTSRQLERIQRNNPNAYPKDDDIERVLKEAATIEPIAQRMLNAGVAALSNIELITILLGEQTPILASRLLTRFQSLSHLFRAGLTDLQSVKGMTPRRAQTLQCALALSQRRVIESPGEERMIIKSPADAAEIFGDKMRGLEQEEMHVLLLNTKNRVVAHTVVYRGSLHTTVIRITEIFKEAVKQSAAGLIVGHYHPSGDPTPSPEDVAVTQEIVKAGKILDIDVLDHLVIGDGTRFVSLKERGLGFG